MNENMLSGLNSAENPNVDPEQQIEGEIDNQLQELASGLDGIKRSLENLDQDDNTPEHTQALKKIWEKYKESEGAFSAMLLAVGALDISTAFLNKMSTHPRSNAEVTLFLLGGIVMLQAGIVGCIRNYKKSKN